MLSLRPARHENSRSRRVDRTLGDRTHTAVATLSELMLLLGNESLHPQRNQVPAVCWWSCSMYTFVERTSVCRSEYRASLCAVDPSFGLEPIRAV